MIPGQGGRPADPQRSSTSLTPRRWCSPRPSVGRAGTHMQTTTPTEYRHLPVYQAGGGTTQKQGQGCRHDGDEDGGRYDGGVQEKMLSDVFLAIKYMWLGGPVDVGVQQDSAPVHSIGSDPDIVAAGTADGWNITLLNQPPNSPETNIQDLFFFNRSSPSTTGLRSTQVTSSKTRSRGRSEHRILLSLAGSGPPTGPSCIY